MRRYTPRMHFCLLALAIVLLCSSCAGAASKIRIAVLNTTDDQNLAQEAEIIVGNLIGTLAKSSALSVVEREELELVISEQKINASQLGDRAAKIGNITGCQYVLLSSLAFESEPVITARLVEVETSEIVYSDTEIPDIGSSSSMTAASSRMADRVLEVLAGERAVVTEILASEVIINRGSSSGVRAGDLYRVYLGTKRSSVNLAVIRVKDVRSGFSTAELVKNGGAIALLRRTDKVEAVSKKEAEDLVRRRKFAKKRPGEKTVKDPSAAAVKRLDTPLDDEQAFWRAVKVSQDITGKRMKEALESKDAKMRNEVGTAFEELGWAVMKRKRENSLDSAYRKLDAVKIGIKHDTQARIQSNEQRYDKTASSFFSLAMGMFQMSAYQSNINALNNLCDLLVSLYEQGIEVSQKNADDSVKLLKIAAEQGVGDALCTLGYMYLAGWGVEQNYDEALKFFGQGAAKGHAESQGCLGQMYYEGWGADKDYAKALELFSQAAGQGDIDSYVSMGIMYLEGKGVTQNYAKALDLFRYAADRGDAQGQTMLGRMYAEGLGVPQNFRMAIELFRKAAETPGIRGDGARNNLKALGIN